MIAGVATGDPQQAPTVSGPHLREQIACAPMSPPLPPNTGLFIAGGAVPGRIMFGPGDAVIVNAGSKQGVQKGQQFFVRRHVKDMFTPASIDFTPVSIHTTGWLTIVDAKDDLSVGQVTQACDAVQDGDYLEPFAEPSFPDLTSINGQPDYQHPARVVMMDEKRQSAAAGMLILLNRGVDHGIRAGQTVTLFRPTLNGNGPILDVGRGTVLSVRPQTALVRIDTSREAVYVGDLAAFNRITP